MGPMVCVDVGKDSRNLLDKIMNLNVIFQSNFNFLTKIICACFFV